MERNVPIRWGFIGCGQATELKMLPAFSELSDAEIVAVMSRNGLRARAFAERHDIPHWYADAQNLVTDPSVDAVSLPRRLPHTPFFRSWPSKPAKQYT